MMNTTQAQAIAEKAVKTVSDFENTVVVGRDKFGYYVADNGDETNGLNRQSAVALIVKCLEAA